MKIAALIVGVFLGVGICFVSSRIPDPYTPDKIIEVVFSYLTLPITVIIFSCLVIASERLRYFIVDIFRNFRQISIFGFSIDASPDSAKKLDQRVALQISLFRNEINLFISREVKRFNIYKNLKKLFNEEILLHCKNIHEEFRSEDWGVRATIHMKDPVSLDNFVQICDYFPPTGGRSSFRRRSLRFGVIGLSWRMEKSIYIKSVDVDDKDEYIVRWGAFDAEVDKMLNKRPSVCAIPLKDSDDSVVGILYMDSGRSSFLGSDCQGDGFADFLEKQSKIFKDLNRAIVELSDELKNLELQRVSRVEETGYGEIENV